MHSHATRLARHCVGEEERFPGLCQVQYMFKLGGGKGNAQEWIREKMSLENRHWVPMGAPPHTASETQPAGGTVAARNRRAACPQCRAVATPTAAGRGEGLSV